MDLSDRLVEHDHWLTARLLENAAMVPDDALDRPIRPGLVVHEFEGPEPDVRTMLERIVFTKEVWTAAIGGRDIPPRDQRSIAALQARLAAVQPQFTALVRRVRSELDAVHRGYQETRAHYPAIAPPEHLFLPGEAFEQTLAERPGADWLGAVAAKDEARRHPRMLLVECSPAEPVRRSTERLKAHLAELGANGLRAVILCDNPGQRDRLRELLDGAEAALGVGLLTAGFTMKHAGLAVLTDHEIFSRYRRRRRRLKKTGGLSLAELSALKVGDLVVHEDHGIGRYRGLQRLTLNGQETDCVEISYAEKDRLYVPVQQLALVSRYAAEEGASPALHRLGSTSWQKTKSRAKAAIQEMADGLIRAYATRRALPGHAFKPDTVWQRELEAAFPYEETPDQLTAIEEVKADMEADRPMDRLICGDVGYGKTEVAVRAAFKAVQDGRQVAVLVPTTILAQQHWLTFKERLADFPVQVEVLSRFTSSVASRWSGVSS